MAFGMNRRDFVKFTAEKAAGTRELNRRLRDRLSLKIRQQIVMAVLKKKGCIWLGRKDDA